MADKPTYEELEQRIRELEKAEYKRQQEEKTLREQLLHLRTLMDVSLDGIAIIDQKHGVRQANKIFAQMLGYTMKEVLDLHTWDWEVIMTEEEIRANFADLTKTKKTFETHHRRKDGTIFDAEVTACGVKLGEESFVMTITRNITERKNAQRALLLEKDKLQAALAKIKQLSGLLPICSYCKKIRDDKGYWNKIESYIHQYSEAEFSHSICPECARDFYPEMNIYDEDVTQG